MRFAFAALALLAAACSPPAAEAPIAPVDEATPSADAQDAIRATINAALTADIGQPIDLWNATIRTEGDWAWVVGQPRTPVDGVIDWSTTKYAEQAAEGMLDGDGTTYALLQRENGVWIVRAFVVGPTDVAYATWPQEYGAPASLLDLE